MEAAKDSWKKHARAVGRNPALLVITTHEKEQVVTGEGGHVEVGHHSSGTNILVLVTGGKHNALQQKGRNEAKKIAGAAEQSHDHAQTYHKAYDPRGSDL